MDMYLEAIIMALRNDVVLCLDCRTIGALRDYMDDSSVDTHDYRMSSCTAVIVQGEQVWRLCDIWLA